MTEPSSEKLLSTIGKTVRDGYGREVGQIVSFMVNPYGHVTEVLIKHEDERFRYYPGDRIRVNDDGEIVLLSDIDVKAKALCEDIPLIWRKDQILGDLVKDERILPETYEDLHQKFEGELKKLKADAQATVDLIDKHVDACTEQFKRLHSAKTYLEIEHAIGAVDVKSYKISLKTMTDGLKRAVREKNDLETVRMKLNNLLLGESPMVEETPYTEEPPVIEETPSVEEYSPDEEISPVEEEPMQVTEETETAEENIPPQEPTITVRVK